MDARETNQVQEAVVSLIDAAGLEPSDVFENEQLEKWAEENGYVEAK